MNGPENKSHEPKKLGELLSDISAVLGHEGDPGRASTAEQARLRAEADELASARDGMIEANQAGDAEHDLTDINHAHLDALADLEEAKRRHPSNPQ